MHNEGVTAMYLSFIVTTKKSSNTRTRPELVCWFFVFSFFVFLIFFFNRDIFGKEKDYFDFPRACFGTQLPPNFLNNRKVPKPQGRRGRRESYIANLFWPCLSLPKQVTTTSQNRGSICTILQKHWPAQRLDLWNWGSEPILDVWADCVQSVTAALREGSRIFHHCPLYCFS